MKDDSYITATEILEQQDTFWKTFEEKAKTSIYKVPRQNNLHYRLYCILLSYIVSNSKQI